MVKSGSQESESFTFSLWTSKQTKVELQYGEVAPPIVKNQDLWDCSTSISFEIRISPVEQPRSGSGPVVGLPNNFSLNSSPLPRETQVASRTDENHPFRGDRGMCVCRLFFILLFLNLGREAKRKGHSPCFTTTHRKFSSGLSLSSRILHSRACTFTLGAAEPSSCSILTTGGGTFCGRGTYSHVCALNWKRKGTPESPLKKTHLGTPHTWNLNCHV